MSIDGPLHRETQPLGRVSFMRRAWQWAWDLGDRGSPVPVYWVAVAVLLGVQLHRTIHDVDIFWQLKLGELTLAHGLPANEPFLAGKEHEPLAAVAWLGQAVFAAVRLVGGWDLLRLFDAVVWLGGFAVVGWTVARRVHNHWWVVIALWAGWFGAVPFASIRPQTFAVFCFGLLVVLTRSSLADRQKIALGTVLLLVWQNLHPSALIGFGYLAAAATGEWGLYFLGRGPRPGFANLVLVPIAAAATLATPAGLGIYDIAAENRDRCLSDMLRITEWLPMWDMWPAVGRAEATPVMLATLVLVLVRGRHVRATDLLSALALLVMTVLTFRFVLFFGIAVIPVLVQCLTNECDPDPAPPRRKVRRAVAAAALLLGLLPLRIWSLNFADYYPFAAASKLKMENVRGPIYCTYLWGGVVTDLGYPDWKPTHDGRYYLFTRDEIAAHLAAGRGEVPVEELDRQFHPVAFFLRTGDADGLIDKLRAAPGWRQVFADSNGVVFVRR